eukprot:3153370-Amphidinium_carterae.1
MEMRLKYKGQFIRGRKPSNPRGTTCAKRPLHQKLAGTMPSRVICVRKKERAIANGVLPYTKLLER